MKKIAPFWIDSNVDIENDPYTSDCSYQTNATNPHAYTQFTIINGEVSSKNCIEKPPGNRSLKILIQMFKKLNTFKYTRHGDFLNVVKPVGLEKGPEVELASAEYVLVLVQGI